MMMTLCVLYYISAIVLFGYSVSKNMSKQFATEGNVIQAKVHSPFMAIFGLGIIGQLLFSEQTATIAKLIMNAF